MNRKLVKIAENPEFMKLDKTLSEIKSWNFLRPIILTEYMYICAFVTIPRILLYLIVYLALLIF
jgi:hypothetical protein